MIYVDAPVGTGFSYSTTQEGYYIDDLESASQLYQFLRTVRGGNYQHKRSVKITSSLIFYIRGIWMHLINDVAVVDTTPSIFGEYTLHWWRFIFRHTSSYYSSKDIWRYVRFILFLIYVRLHINFLLRVYTMLTNYKHNSRYK